jgi:hypothetical protein
VQAAAFQCRSGPRPEPSLNRSRAKDFFFDSAQVRAWALVPNFELRRETVAEKRQDQVPNPEGTIGPASRRAAAWPSRKASSI